MRSSHGRKPIFADPDVLWDACVEYFDWVEKNPLQEAQAFAYQGDVKLQDLPKLRAMTISGLCIFLDIDRSTWSDYGKRDDFIPIVTRVEEVIRTQKFEGAAAGLLNPNIIARDLGLADKQELEHGVTDPLADLMKAIASRGTSLVPATDDSEPQ